MLKINYLDALDIEMRIFLSCIFVFKLGYQDKCHIQNNQTGFSYLSNLMFMYLVSGYTVWIQFSETNRLPKQ